jgi:hypothetical protein
MGSCDLCNEDIGPSARRVSASEFRAAVRNGLRPRGVAAALNAAFGADATAGWITFVMQDSSQWALCPGCAAEFERRLRGGRRTEPAEERRQKVFQGNTIEEAEAKARAFVSPNQIVQLTRHPPGAGTAEGEGADPDAATAAARKRIPDDAINLAAAEILQPGGG